MDLQKTMETISILEKQIRKLSLKNKIYFIIITVFFVYLLGLTLWVLFNIQINWKKMSYDHNFY